MPRASPGKCCNHAHTKYKGKGIFGGEANDLWGQCLGLEFFYALLEKGYNFSLLPRNCHAPTERQGKRKSF